MSGDLTGMCTGAQNGKLPCLEISQVCVHGHRMGNYHVWRSHRFVYRGTEWETTMSGDLTGMCTGAQNGKLQCLEISQVCVQGHRMGNYRVWRSHRFVYRGTEWETTMSGDLTGMCTGAQNGKLPCLEISQVCLQGHRMWNYHVWRSHRFVYRDAEWETTVSGDLTGMCTGAQNGKLPCLEISQVCVQGHRMGNYRVWRSHRYVYMGTEWETTMSGDLTGMCTGAQNGKLPCLEISQVCLQGHRMWNYHVWRSHRFVYRDAEWETTVSGDLTGLCTGTQNGKLPCLEISQVCVQSHRMGNYRVWRSHRYVYMGLEQKSTVSGDLTGMCTGAQNGKLPCLEISQVCLQGHRMWNYHVWRSHRFVYRDAEWETTVSGDLTGLCTGTQNGKLPCLEISQVCVQSHRMGNYRVWRSHRYVYMGLEQKSTVSGDLTGMCTGAQNGKLPCLEISQVCVQGPRMGNYHVWRSHRYVYRDAEWKTTVSGDLTGRCTGAQNGKLACLEISQVCVHGLRTENYRVWRSHRYVYLGSERKTTVSGDLTGMCTWAQNRKLLCLEISQVCVHGRRMGNYHVRRSHR